MSDDADVGPLAHAQGLNALPKYHAAVGSEGARPDVVAASGFFLHAGVSPESHRKTGYQSDPLSSLA